MLARNIPAPNKASLCPVGEGKVPPCTAAASYICFHSPRQSHIVSEYNKVGMWDIEACRLSNKPTPKVEGRVTGKAHKPSCASNGQQITVYLCSTGACDEMLSQMSLTNKALL